MINGAASWIVLDRRGSSSAIRRAWLRTQAARKSGCTGVARTVASIARATVLTEPLAPRSPRTRSIAARTAPQPDFLGACVRNQARRIAEELPRRSALIDAAAPSLVPAVYDLRSGLVARY